MHFCIRCSVYVHRKNWISLSTSTPSHLSPSSHGFTRKFIYDGSNHHFLLYIIYYYYLFYLRRRILLDLFLCSHWGDWAYPEPFLSLRRDLRKQVLPRATTPFYPQIKISQIQIKKSQNKIKKSQNQIKRSQNQI